MNRLAFRLGLCGGLLAFAGNALVMFSRDPNFESHSSAQVIQMSLMWFGFTALVGSVVGWGIWALSTMTEERKGSRGEPEQVQARRDTSRVSSPSAASRAYAAGASPGVEAQSREDESLLESVSPETAARVVRESLRQQEEPRE